MELFKILLYIHISGGLISLIAGTAVVILKKADKTHAKLGRIFYYGLLVASLVSLPMAFLHPNYFLFIVGIFSSYMILSGRRYLKIKSISDIKWQDKLLALTMFVFGSAFIVFGIYNLINNYTFGIVFLVFGFVSLRFVFQDYKNFNGESKFKNFGLVTHIQRMTGGFIASVTAFTVVNINFSPAFIIWLLPSAVIVPFIIIWGKKWGKMK